MKTPRIFIGSVIFFLGLLVFIPNNLIPSALGSIVLTVTAFLFGIIAGFYIVVTTTDYNNLKNTLAAETGGWIALFSNLRVYDEPSAQKIVPLIDSYVRRNFDFEVIEYASGNALEFEQLESAVRELPLKTDLSNSYVYQEIRNTMRNIIIARQQLSVLGTKSLSFFQWVVLYVLAAIFIFSLYGLRTGAVYFDAITVAMSSSVVLVLLLIHDLDLYVWNEKAFSFDIFQNVLRSIGQLPYYPAETLEHGRIRPTETEYRVGTRNAPGSRERTLEIHKVA